MAIREGLLALLERGPRHGYQLKTEFEAATGRVWPLNVGQVYSTLDRLTRDGLVEVSDSDEQKLYALSAPGRDELGTWWTPTFGDDPPPRDELMLKVLMASDHGSEHALRVVDEHRTALFGLLQQRRRQAVAADLSAQLVGDALMVRAEADLRWLDLCEQRLHALGSPDASVGDTPGGVR